MTERAPHTGTTSASHVSLRVSDIERSTKFYTDVFGGELVMDIELQPEFVTSIFGAPPGTKAQNRFIKFRDFAIEIYEFRPGKPIPPTDQAADGMIHFCLSVDDVPATVAKLEQAGGRRLFPIRPMFEGRHFVYTADPDGHVVELIDAPLEECVAWVGRGVLPDHTKDAGA